MWVVIQRVHADDDDAAMKVRGISRDDNEDRRYDDYKLLAV